MPDKLRAGGSFPYTLEGDRNETQQPQFKIRVLSASDNDAVIDLRDEFIAAETKTDRMQIVGQIVDICIDEVLIDGYSKLNLEDLLTDRERWELISAAIEGAALTAEERKKYVLPPQSDSEPSANDAVAEANA